MSMYFCGKLANGVTASVSKLISGNGKLPVEVIISIY